MLTRMRPIPLIAVTALLAAPLSHAATLGADAPGATAPPASAGAAPTQMHPLQLAQAATADRGRTERNAELRFRVVVPSTWVSVKPTDPNIRMMVNAPAGANPASCRVAVYDVPDLRALRQDQLDWAVNNHGFGIEGWTAVLAEQFTDVAVREQGPTKLGARPIHAAVAAVTDAAVTAMPYNVILTFLAQTPGRQWQFICTAMGADQRAADAGFGVRRIEFLRMMSTFVWEN